MLPYTDFLLHRCSNSCEFVRCGCLLICMSSTHLHHCTPTFCKRKVRSREGYICELTGVLYENSLTSHTGEDENASGEGASNDCNDDAMNLVEMADQVFEEVPVLTTPLPQVLDKVVVATDTESQQSKEQQQQQQQQQQTNQTGSSKSRPKEKCNRKFTQLLQKWNADDNDTTPESKEFDAKKPVIIIAKKEKKKKRRKVKEITDDQWQQKQALAMRVIDDAFRPNMNTNTNNRNKKKKNNKKKKQIQQLPQTDNAASSSFIPTADQKRQMCEICLEKWQQVTSTQLYREEKFGQYQFEYHILVVLYEMIEGFNLYKGDNPKTVTVVVPLNPIVRQMLHQRKDMLAHNQHRKWTASQITRTTKLFHSFIKQFYC